MKKYLQKTLCIVLVSLLVSTGCGRQSSVQSSVDTGMGTIIRQTIYTTRVAGQGEDSITEEVLQCIRGLEEDTLSWRLENAELYKINAAAGSKQAIELSPRLWEFLDRCKRVYEASEGAFDFTIGGVARLWQIDSWVSGENAADASAAREKFLPPSQEQLSEALAYVGCEKLLFDGQRITVPEGMQLDLGAVGKGAALDEIQVLLNAHTEVLGAVISVGGSIMTYGCKPDGSSWNVGVVNPFDTSRSLGTLSLTGEWCISTSGDYERFVEVDGVRYHHILDPALGRPADSGVKSVTILCKDGLLGDALSTACFVLGVEEGMKLAEEFHAEAVFVDAQGEVYQTPGMSQYFSLSREEK